MSTSRRFLVGAPSHPHWIDTEQLCFHHGQTQSSREDNKRRVFCRRRRWNSFVRWRRWRCDNELQWGPKLTTHTSQHPGFKCWTPAQQPRLSPTVTNHPPFYCNAPDVKGCPLSPLLFAVAIELSCHRQKKSAVHCSFVDHRISLYAYDVVLFLSHPEESLPPLC